MRDYGAQNENVYIAVMPAIAQRSYEVDQSFYNNFLEQDSQNEKYFEINDNQKYQFDLRGYNIDIIKNLGISNIDDIDIDTYERDDICYSYRRATHEEDQIWGVIYHL